MATNDAIDVLKTDHQIVSDLFSELEIADRSIVEARRSIVDHICDALMAHTQIEEEVFYPSVRQRAEEMQDEVVHALKEHREIKDLIAEVREVRPEDDAFDGKVRALQTEVEHHVKEEESEMFPTVQRLLDETTLAQLGDQLREAKAKTQAMVTTTP